MTKQLLAENLKLGIDNTEKFIKHLEGAEIDVNIDREYVVDHLESLNKDLFIMRDTYADLLCVIQLENELKEEVKLT